MRQFFWKCYYSAFRLHRSKSMHSSALQGTDSTNRSLARDCLGITLQLQDNASRDSGRLNCYLEITTFRYRT